MDLKSLPGPDYFIGPRVNPNALCSLVSSDEYKSRRAVVDRDPVARYLPKAGRLITVQLGAGSSV